jgi:hypothetical protein
MGSLSYTIGNWTVASNESDTISTPKTLTIPDLDYASDFSLSQDKGKEAIILNVTGGTLEPVERLRYAKEKVNDIYRTTETLKSNQLPSPIGARILAESLEIVKATNSINAAEYDIPLRVWTCVESSTHNAVTGAALLWALKRHFAAMFGTGVVTEDMLIALFRGDLNPAA